MSKKRRKEHDVGIQELKEAIDSLREEIALLRQTPAYQYPPVVIPPAQYPGYNPWPTIYCQPPVNTSWV